MATAFKKMKQKFVEVESSNSDESEQEVQSKASQSEGEENKEEQEAVEQVDSEDELRAFKDPDPQSKEWKNRQRTLILISRGIAGRFRHLVEDIMGLIPNVKKE